MSATLSGGTAAATRTKPKSERASAVIERLETLRSAGVARGLSPPGRPADEAAVVARFVAPGSGSADLTVALCADPVRACLSRAGSSAASCNVMIRQPWRSPLPRRRRCCSSAAKGVPFTEHAYRYEERGGTAVAARELRVPEHAVVKTLVMEDEAHKPLIVLMHGDREVSTKNLARQVGAQGGHAVQARRGDAAHRLPRRRHVAVRHPQADARSTSSGRFSTCRRSTSTAGAADSCWGWRRRTWCGSFAPRSWTSALE